jgi:phosphoenolpyruvate carboxylase
MENSLQRKFSATMASQHPDHAGKPFWYNKEFISTRQEVKECFLTFSDLGISEYKWDWEGKFVDESVVDKMLSEHFDFFQKHPLGKDTFITFRLPNPKVETEFRLGRAFMCILAAAGLAHHIGLHSPPLFEVILPMTETAGEMIAIQEAFREIASLKHQLYNFTDDTIKHIEVIPLFETVETMMRSDEVLSEYISMHRKQFGTTPNYLRPYVARSDPALNSGIVPTVLAIKIALSQYAELAQKSSIPMSPIIGSASLPFRGGLTPYTVNQFAREYQGVRTALIQSAFRYDFPLEDVKQGIAQLNDILPKNDPVHVTNQQKKMIKEVIPHFERPYRASIEELAPVVNDIAKLLPRRRERVQHIGLFGYSRGVGSVRLPRAIGFCAAMYSIGIPPELVGTGRGLQEAKKLGILPIVEEFYTGFKENMRQAGRFLHKKSLNELAKGIPACRDIQKDVSYIEEYLGEELGPKTSDEIEHGKLTEDVLASLPKNKLTPELLSEIAVLRKSLG